MSLRVLVVTAMYPSHERPAKGTFVQTQVEALRRMGVDVGVLHLRAATPKRAYLAGPRRLQRALRAGPWDLVHAHHAYAGAVARTQWQRPTVLTYHGSDLLGAPQPDGRLSPVARADAWAARKLSRAMDGVIVQSREMAERLGDPRARVIPQELDLERFRPVDREQARRELGLAPGRPYALFASPPATPVKNHALAVAAMAQVRATLPEAELLVVHGRPQAELPAYLSAADVLLLTSWQEGSPNVLKQAMACGLPVVAADVGDVREVLGTTRDSAVVPGWDASAFAQAAADLLGRRPRTDGRAAVERFTSAHITPQIIDLYEGVLAGSRAGSRRARH